MLGVATVAIVILLSLIVTRVATVILTLTGLSREAARFQARSAFSGVGFTTSEAESLVSHPVRRRVVMALMLVGSAGLIAVVASLFVSFSQAGGQASAVRLGMLVGILAAIWLLARSPVVDRAFSGLVRRLLRRYTRLDAHDYASLLELSDRWAVAELRVTPGHWLAGRTVGDLRLRDEGLALLGIHRPDRTYIGVPVNETLVGEGDAVLLYGADEAIAELGARPAGPEGARAHEAAVARQRGRLAEQAVRDARSGGGTG